MDKGDLDPHASQPVLHAGAELENARVVLVLIHGRGASPQNMLLLFDELRMEGVAAIAPQAAGSTWYPQSFLAPLASNQPFLNSALAKIQTIIDDLLHQGFSSDRIALLGFSQGACLTSEFVARNPQQYGAVMALTGGLIGPPGTPRNYPGDLAQTPVFLGSGDPDPHVPFARVLETEAVFTRMGGKVEMRRYPGMPHSVNEDELEVCRNLLRQLD